MPRKTQDNDSERLLEDLVRRVHEEGPDEVLAAASEYGSALGLHHITVYLIDLQQRLLVPLTGGEPLGVDDSHAGEAYRTQALGLTEGNGEQIDMWFPLRDGADRMGVLHVRAPALDAPTLRRCRVLSSLLALIVTSKRAYSDTYVLRTRTQPMRLWSEMLRAFLPPRTLGTRDVVSTAVLEPAYELGGDAFDHSITRNALHTVILDAMGHDLSAGLTASVAMAGARNARRSGADLAELTDNVEHALTTWLPDGFCTGVFAQLGLSSGVLSWINCGHPAPILIRGKRVVTDALARTPEAPLGLGKLSEAGSRTVHSEQLTAGDRVLFYTDGITEAHDNGGDFLGLEKFTDFIIRANAADEDAPETMRRLMHSILEHQRGSLGDDATIMLVEWRRQGADRDADAPLAGTASTSVWDQYRG